MGLRSRRAVTRFDVNPRPTNERPSAEVAEVAPVAARVLRLKSSGVESMHLAFPSPTADSDRIDVSYLLRVPSLAEPFADALLRKLAGDSKESRHSLTKWLRLGFFRYLKEKELEEVTLNDLGAPFFKDYIRWLDRINPKTKAAYWSQRTKTSYLLALRITINALKGLPKWKARVQRDLSVPTHQWVGAGRRHKPTPILSDEDLGLVYKTCLKEINETRSRVEVDLHLAAACKEQVPRDATSFRHYPTRGVALAAMAELLPDRIPAYPELQKTNRPLLAAVKNCFGGVVDLRTALAPSPRQLVPFVVMLAFHTHLNPETLLASDLNDFYTDTRLGELRFFSRHYKGRAGRRQRPSKPVDDAWDNPNSIFEFLKTWTSRIRPLTPRKAATKLFIYVPRTSKTHVAFFNVDEPTGSFFAQVLREFCTDHALRPFTLRQIRPTTLDIGRALFRGDIRAAQALGDHRSEETTNSHYTSDAQRKRNEERLAEIVSERSRWLESNGKVDARGITQEADEGAATPGWRCFDPYRSPFSPHGKLCIAFAHCPVCPLGHIDVESPLACGLTLTLLDAIRRSKTTLDPQGWLERMAPIEKRLIEYWLPRFSVRVMDSARSLSLPPLPTPE